MNDEELKRLVAAMQHMTEAEREEQAFPFAYGNLALTTNHKPVRAAFRKLAMARGWIPERFDAWAEGREWRT